MKEDYEIFLTMCQLINTTQKERSVKEDYEIFLTMCQLIGSVSDSNGRYQQMLYEGLADWRSMSVLDLFLYISYSNEKFNRLEALARREA